MSAELPRSGTSEDIELNSFTKNIGERFIECSRLIVVLELCFILCYAMRQFMANHVQLNQRVVVAAIAQSQ